MNLFRTLDDLKPFIFRITDNGGESADRFTVITCDGDYFAMSGAPFHPQGFGQTGEGIDVQGVADRVEAGVERDLRWIDLPRDCQRCVMDGLNRGFEDYIEQAPAAATRDAARNWQGIWNDYSDGTAIYRDGDAYRIRDDDEGYPNASVATDPGPFADFAEAVRYMLPEDYSLSGPEYHTTADLWDESGGAAPLWDCEAEPPKPYKAMALKTDDAAPGPLFVDLDYAESPEAARDLCNAWLAENSDKADLYEPAYSHKVESVIHRY